MLSAASSFTTSAGMSAASRRDRISCASAGLKLRNTVTSCMGDDEVDWAQNQAATGVLASAKISTPARSEEHTSELQSQSNLVCRLLLEKKKKKQTKRTTTRAGASNHFKRCADTR